jgi:hypothetical protein
MVNQGLSKLLKGTFAGVSSLFLVTAPAQAGDLAIGSTFSIFLECNNDGMAQILGKTNTINNWQYTSDAKDENTDGFLYDILGMATKETANELIVILSGNTPIGGTGFDRDTNQVGWGDLFFSAGGQSFTESMNSGNLFGIKFAKNESGPKALGVYSGVTAKGVGINNFGHRTLENYMNLVDTSSANFLGDIKAADLVKSETYFDPTTGYNVIGQGTKVNNDGFTLLSLTDSILSDFDQQNFKTPGVETIAFKINKSALQVQKPLKEQAAELAVAWNPEWDTKFAEIATSIKDIDAQISTLNKNQITPLEKANTAVRNAYPGHKEALDLKKAKSTLDNTVKDTQKQQTVLDVLQFKLDKWNAMTPNEQANAAPEDVWTRKDALDIDDKKQKIQANQTIIDGINAQYTSSQLTNANKAYNALINQIRKDFPEYVQRETDLKPLYDQRNELKDQKNALNAEKSNLEAEIRAILANQRQELVLASAAEEKEQEAATGGPRTSKDNGVPKTEAELKKALGQETETVPEPMTMAGLALGASGMIAARRRRANKNA